MNLRTSIMQHCGGGSVRRYFAHCGHISSLRQSHTEPHRSSFIIHQLNLKSCPCVVIGSSLSLPQPQFVFIEHQQSSISKQTVDAFHQAQNRSNYTQHGREEKIHEVVPINYSFKKLCRNI